MRRALLSSSVQDASLTTLTWMLGELSLSDTLSALSWRSGTLLRILFANVVIARLDSVLRSSTLLTEVRLVLLAALSAHRSLFGRASKRKRMFSGIRLWPFSLLG